MADVTPDPIIQVASGFLGAKFLFVANELGLFERLAGGPATLDELARRMGVSRRTMRILADAMVALGVVERRGEHYQNGPAAATFLSGRTPADLRPFLKLWDRLSYVRCTKLEDAIRADRPPFGEFTAEEQQIYSAGVEAITAGTAQALPTSYDFGTHRRVLDLGGGTGSFLIPLLDQWSGLEGTLFELPPVAAIARGRLAGSPCASRIRIVAGDFFKDPIPEAHDAVILANILHNLPPERGLKLLRHIRSAVPIGARLLLVDFWTDSTHTQPPFAALMAGEFLLTPGGGDVYSVDEARAWLLDSGWRMLEHRPLAGPASLIVAEAAGP